MGGEVKDNVDFTRMVELRNLRWCCMIKSKRLSELGGVEGGKLSEAVILQITKGGRCPVG